MTGMTVVPHEYIHAWCGKLAAPEGLVRDDYHTPLDSSLLWVYEGLTTYYTPVLAARSGMMSDAEWRDWVTRTVERYQLQPGRLWRSVEDTARAVEQVRTPSPRWADMRRRADYYSEAALFWMEADAIIRTKTNGRRTLDDFTSSFFDVPVEPVGSQHTYDRDDVVRHLRRVEPTTDWDALIRERIERPVRRLEMRGLLDALGVAFVYTSEPSSLQRERAARASGVNLRAELGMSVDDQGEIASVVPGGLADTAGLGYGDRVFAVAGKTFTPERLRTAVRKSRSVGHVDLIISSGDDVRSLRFAYAEGRKFPELRSPMGGGPDMITRIGLPRTEAGRALRGGD
jgi:predicted metalloprotease with PDZ domain